MIKAIAEQEHYLLVSDGRRFTVMERRAGKYYSLRGGVRVGHDLDDGSVAQLTRKSSLAHEDDAHRLLASIASEWRTLCEQIR